MASSARIDELRKKFDENPRRYFAPLANEYRKAGDAEQAIFICQEYLPQQPGHMSGHIVYGQALFELGRHDEARTVFETALSLDPENLIALRHLGDIARIAGDATTARVWYQRVLEADPRNEEIAQLMLSLLSSEPLDERAVRASAPTPLTNPAVASAPAESMPATAPAAPAAMPVAESGLEVERSEEASLASAAPFAPTPATASPAAEPWHVSPHAPKEADLLDLDDFDLGGVPLSELRAASPTPPYQPAQPFDGSSTSDIELPPMIDADAAHGSVAADAAAHVGESQSNEDAVADDADARFEPDAFAVAATPLVDDDAHAPASFEATTDFAADLRLGLPDDSAAAPAEAASDATMDGLETFEAGVFPSSVGATESLETESFFETAPISEESATPADASLDASDSSEPESFVETSIAFASDFYAEHVQSAAEPSATEQSAAEHSDVERSEISGSESAHSPVETAGVDFESGAQSDALAGGTPFPDISAAEGDAPHAPAAEGAVEEGAFVDGSFAEAAFAEAAFAEAQFGEGASPEEAVSDEAFAGDAMDDDVDAATPEAATFEAATPEASSPEPSTPDAPVAPPVEAFVTETMAELYLEQGHLDSALDIYRKLVEQRPDDASLADRMRAVEDRVHGAASANAFASGADGDAMDSDAADAPDVARARSFGGPTIREFLSGLARKTPEYFAVAPDVVDEPVYFARSSTDQAYDGIDEPFSSDASLLDDAIDAPLDQFEAAPNQHDSESFAEPGVHSRSGASSRESLSGSLGALFSGADAAAADAAAANTLAQAFAPNSPETAALEGMPAHRASSELSLDHVFKGNPSPRASGATDGFSFDQFFSEDAIEDSSQTGSDSPAAPPQGADDIAQFNAWLNGLKKT